MMPNFSKETDVRANWMSLLSEAICLEYAWLLGGDHDALNAKSVKAARFVSTTK